MNEEYGVRSGMRRWIRGGMRQKTLNKKLGKLGIPAKTGNVAEQAGASHVLRKQASRRRKKWLTRGAAGAAIGGLAVGSREAHKRSPQIQQSVQQSKRFFPGQQQYAEQYAGWMAALKPFLGKLGTTVGKGVGKGGVLLGKAGRATAGKGGMKGALGQWAKTSGVSMARKGHRLATKYPVATGVGTVATGGYLAHRQSKKRRNVYSAEGIEKYPFKSEAQRRWMHTNHPEMAKRWEKETAKKLPERVKKHAMQQQYALKPWQKAAAIGAGALGVGSAGAALALRERGLRKDPEYIAATKRLRENKARANEESEATPFWNREEGHVTDKTIAALVDSRRATRAARKRAIQRRKAQKHTFGVPDATGPYGRGAGPGGGRADGSGLRNYSIGSAARRVGSAIGRHKKGIGIGAGAAGLAGAGGIALAGKNRKQLTAFELGKIHGREVKQGKRPRASAGRLGLLRALHGNSYVLGRYMGEGGES